jgi:arylsulfatase A-like enzyme/tetratricopeptide (TPR) repeat protein
LRRGRATVTLTLALLLASCRSRPPETWPEASVVLVSIDTLRADHLPLYGYARGSTPNIDALGREGIVFDSVYSHCPLTLPAHASMLTGLIPPHHGVHDNAGFTLKPGTRTLAARFHEAGLATGAAVSAFVLRRATGIAQGFDRYDDAIVQDASLEDMGEQQRDGATAVASLLGWIEAQGGRRFFAFLHLYEPHTPYAPPSPYKERFADSLYDGEVAYADELVGRLLAPLRVKGALDHTVVAVTADHGEGLGEHGEKEHGFFLYRETVRVPLVLRLPGAAHAGTRLSATAAQVDLPATLLDLAGVPGAGMDGVSLRPAIAGSRGPGRPAYSETFFPRYHFGWSELLSATESRFRYIRAPRPELFDEAADPAETRNVIAEHAAALQPMSAWLDTQVRVGDVARPADVDPDTMQRLEALGYVGGGGPAAAAAGPLADPKDKIAVFEAYKGALTLRREGKDAEVVAALRAVVADSPGMLDAWQAMGLALARLGRVREAVQALQTALRLDPSRGTVHLALAKVYEVTGQAGPLEEHARAAALALPGEGYEILATLRLAQNRLAEAAEAARRSLEADPGRVAAHYVLGVVAHRAGHCDEAVPEFEKAAAAQGLHRSLVVRGLHSALGDCLARAGREADAEREFRAEIDAIPYTKEGRVGLAALYRSQGRDAEARSVLEGVVTANPRAGAEEYATVVRTFSVLGEADAARAWAARARARFPEDRRFR